MNWIRVICVCLLVGGCASLQQPFDPMKMIEGVIPSFTPRAEPVKPIRPQVLKAKRKKATIKRSARPRVVVEEGPDLPWPCRIIRAHTQGKSDAELTAMGVASGVKLSKKQLRQARACMEQP